MDCYCYGLDLECPLKANVFKTWSPVQQYSEVGLVGSDQIKKVLTTSMDYSIDGFTYEKTTGRWWKL